ncbi:MAG TPA: nuclear transport factor 2 family protein [Kofleriaceae bacterium]|jgi:heme-degrading monooxygenase HmoA/ketosteroid isomerase-like protein|nr:nuclear transport factor 2 family protein [Kofleriaceae bacterium]
MSRMIVFRSRLRDGIADAYNPDAERMFGLAVAMPGFVAAKDFAAEDGERCAVIEFDSAAHLAAWRDHGEHVTTQQVGRDRYYSEYRLSVCGVIRESHFDGAVVTRRDADTRPIAERWLDRFEARDLDGLLALYADDATHSSPKIRVRHPETGGKLVGKPALRAWWADSFERLPALRYIPTSITADADRALLEYIRRLPGEADLPIAEVFDIERGLIVASRVFHG